MKGCLRWFIYLIVIIIAISACSAIFGDDKKSTGDSKSNSASETKQVYSYNEDKAIANQNGAFSGVCQYSCRN